MVFEKWLLNHRLSLKLMSLNRDCAVYGSPNKLNKSHDGKLPDSKTGMKI